MGKKPGPSSDGELVSRAQKGDASAFEEIYDRHAAGIARTLAAFAGPDRDVLDDLTQDVFFKVIENIASYTPSHPFAHWLYTIALNIGRNHARGRSKIVVLDPSEFDGFSSGGDHEGEWVDEVLEAQLFRLVSRLPGHMRDVVSLRIGSEMPYTEIAGALGIPEGTARSRMHSAIRTLKAEMGIPDSRRKENER